MSREHAFASLAADLPQVDRAADIDDETDEDCSGVIGPAGSPNPCDDRLSCG